MALGRGEIMALVGESGCGKTTLARTLLGLVQPRPARSSSTASPCPTRARTSRPSDGASSWCCRTRPAALNPRHSVYEAVAEGLRIHGIADREEERVARGALAGGAPPARAVLPALPPRAVGRAAAARRHRGRARARAGRDRRRRAGLQPRRLGPRRDPRPAAPPPRRAGALPPRRDPRPRPRLEHRRPRRRDVSRPRRRAGTDRGAPGRTPSTPTPAPCSRSCPRSSVSSQVLLTGEPPDVDKMPAGCRFHPRCPAVSDGTAEAAGILTACRTQPLPILAAHTVMRPPASSRSPGTPQRDPAAGILTGVTDDLLGLFPPQSTLAADGTLTVGGCRLDDLAEAFGTPTLVVDEAALRARARAYREGLAARWPRSRVVFASKSFPCTADPAGDGRGGARARRGRRWRDHDRAGRGRRPRAAGAARQRQARRRGRPRRGVRAGHGRRRQQRRHRPPRDATCLRADARTSSSG